MQTALPPRLLERLAGQRGDTGRRTRLEDAYDRTAPVEARVRAALWLLASERTDSKLVALKILAQHREEPPFDDIYQEPLASLLDKLAEGWMNQVPYADYVGRVRSYAACLLGSAAKAEPVVEKMRRFYGDPDMPAGALDDMIVCLGDPDTFEMADVAAARQATQRGMYALLPHMILDNIEDLDQSVDWWLRNVGLGQLPELTGKTRKPAEKRVLLEALRLCDFLKDPAPDLWKIFHGKPGYRLIARCFPDAPKLFQQWMQIGAPAPLTSAHVRRAADGVNSELEEIARWTKPAAG